MNRNLESKNKLTEVQHIATQAYKVLNKEILRSSSSPNRKVIVLALQQILLASKRLEMLNAHAEENDYSESREYANIVDDSWQTITRVWKHTQDVIRCSK